MGTLGPAPQLNKPLDPDATETPRPGFMPKENPVQYACLQLLTYAGIFHWRNNTGAFVVPASPGRARRFVAYGAKGSPDIIAVWKGRFIGIECKAPGKKQSDDQIEFEKNLTRAGGWYWLIDNSPQLEERLRAIGALL